MRFNNKKKSAREEKKNREQFIKEMAQKHFRSKKNFRREQILINCKQKIFYLLSILGVVLRDDFTTLVIIHFHKKASAQRRKENPKY